MDAPEVASAIGSIASAIIAVFAWRASRNSARAAASLFSIEKAKWHADLRPQFEAVAHLLDIAEPQQSAVFVVITLTGPDALHRLDSVEFSLRPTHQMHWNKPGPVPRAKDPYRFNPGEGDTIAPSILVLNGVVLGDPEIVVLEPVEYKPADGSYRPPVKLMAVCQLKDHEPWSVPITVDKIDQIRRPNLDAVKGTAAAEPATVDE